jgi:hypothetical protein
VLAFLRNGGCTTIGVLAFLRNGGWTTIGVLAVLRSGGCTTIGVLAVLRRGGCTTMGVLAFLRNGGCTTIGVLAIALIAEKARTEPRATHFILNEDIWRTPQKDNGICREDYCIEGSALQQKYRGHVKKLRDNVCLSHIVRN